MYRLLATTAALWLITAAAAVADERTAGSGQVTATLSYEQPEDLQFTDLWLTVARAGQAVLDDPLDIDGCDEPFCVPTAAVSDDGSGLTVLDLDADGEPEVIVDVFTGGAHCCAITRVLRWDGSRYVASERNWFDPGYTLRDLDGDGRPEFQTADARFAYEFAAFAFSGLPVRVLSYDAGRFTDVTRSHKPQVRRDARRHKRLYRRALRRDWPSLGLLAAWTADQYLLDRERVARRFLRHELRAGRLNDGRPYKRGRAYIRKLTRTLRRWGY